MTMVTTTCARARARRNRGTPRAVLRQRIGHAALSLFHEVGYDRVSVDQIVARAAVSKGAFFNFFPTKADVLLVYFDEIDRRLARLRARLDPRQPQLALEKFFAKAETLLRSEGPLIETLTRAIWSIPALLEADRASALRDRFGFTAFFERAQSEGTINPEVNPEVAGDAIGDLWTGSVLLWLALGRKESLAKKIRPKIHLLFDGLSKRKRKQ